MMKPVLILLLASVGWIEAEAVGTVGECEALIVSEKAPGEVKEPVLITHAAVSKRNMLIVGTSRGLGHALATGLADQGGEIWLVSRSVPVLPQHVRANWIEADLRNTPTATETIRQAVGDLPVHLFVFTSGFWEEELAASAKDAKSILDVNLYSLIEITRAVENNLKQGRGHLILIGSLLELKNDSARSTAWEGAQLGVQGIARAFREQFKGHQVKVTSLNIGSTSTDIPLGDVDLALQTYEGQRMPMEDVVSLVRCLLNLSPMACVNDLTVPALRDL